MYDIAELAKKLGNGNPAVRAFAAQDLWNAAFHCQDISAAVGALANALSDTELDVRRRSASALEVASRNGADMTVAIPALQKALFDENMSVRTDATCALREAASSEKNPEVALFVLLKALSGTDEDARRGARAALEGIIMKCGSTRRLDLVEAGLAGEYRALERRCGHDKDELIAIGPAFSSLMKEIAKKRNALAASRDILLSGKPRPPKCETKVYRALERVRNG
jgi:hypothetical protein